MSRCRSCPAQVLFAQHYLSGAWMIFDNDPVSRDEHGMAGLFVLRRGDRTVDRQWQAWPAEKAIELTAQRNELSEAEAIASLDRQEAWRVSHFATCPNANAHRRG